MKIGVISDLHIDRYNDEKLQQKDFTLTLANEVNRQSLDVLLIAGDISNDHMRSYRFMQALEQMTGVVIYFVPGNHDFWNQSGDDKTTQEIHQFFKSTKYYKEGEPVDLGNGWAIVMNAAWYDYTYASDRFSKSRLEERSYYGGTWQDLVRVDWGKSDPEISLEFAEKAAHDLEMIKDKKIILMTHVATHKAFRVPMPNRLFDYYNAFIGTSDFDTFYGDYDIKYSVMGHIHFRHQVIEGGVKYICACLGYRREWLTKDIVHEIRDALEIIEI
ncbi:metallophosphoesterase [Jeotgalicoccus sp. S0W5]|uniref:metallophosphoesterase n=1 Tax=Jeotgalicoccus sp. S0W5 TaxID=2527874 RepID=UPI001414D5FB|nr:metallophosphoesterase [Jeotgalicoccus sp. S0W5]